MRPLRLAIVCVLLGLGCGGEAAPPAATVDAGAPAEVTTAPPAPPARPARPEPPPPAARPAVVARAGDVVPVAAGTLKVGSRPGVPHRRPSVEADLTPLALPAFDIDRLPYPNDPDREPQLAATRAEAAQLCEARGRRLCDELEWERACRGDGDDEFATGDALDLEACVADPTACPSELGVLDLGIRAPEWTASDADERLARLERTAVVRGGRPDSSLASHRCGARHVKNPAGGGRALAFRCCGGEAPSVSYPDVGVRRLWRDLEDVGAERWREILASVPELAPYAQDFVPYGETAALRALARGGASEEDMQWELTRHPFAWSPSTGEEVWIVSGRGGDVSLLAALYTHPDGSFSHAASFFVREEEPPPFAVLRTRASRGELLWSTCWGCAGESGVVRFAEDATIVIAQQ